MFTPSIKNPRNFSFFGGFDVIGVIWLGSRCPLRFAPHFIEMLVNKDFCFFLLLEIYPFVHK